MRSDRELLDAWAAGDERGGRELFRRHADALTSFLLHRCGDEASDLVQHTFLRTLDAARRGQAITSVRGFLYAVARNAAIDLLRKRAPERAIDPAVTSLRELGPGPSTALREADDRARLREAMTALALDDQIALELYYWRELSMTELAEALGVGRSAAISKVHRARARLRSLLEAGEARGDTAALVESLGPEP